MTNEGKTIKKGIALNHDGMKILRVVRRFPIHREYSSGERKHLCKGLVISLEKNPHPGDWIGDEVWGDNVWPQLINHVYGYPLENAVAIPANALREGIRGEDYWVRVSEGDLQAIRKSEFYWLDFKARKDLPKKIVFSGPLNETYRDFRLRKFESTGMSYHYSWEPNITRPLFSIQGTFFYTPEIWNQRTFEYEQHYEWSPHKTEKYVYQGAEQLTAKILGLYHYWTHKFGLACIQACPGFFPESETSQDVLNKLESIAQAIERKSVSG